MTNHIPSISVPDASNERNYEEINRCLYNERAEYHKKSEYYNFNQVLHGTALNSIELDALGGQDNIKGKRILDLGCHLGLKTMSLAKLGADHVVGIDISDRCIQQANQWCEEANLTSKVTFVNCSIFDLKTVLKEDHQNSYDIVFISCGVIMYISDLMKVASVINYYLKLNGYGKLVMVEFHPAGLMLENNYDEFADIGYFKTNPIIKQIKGTYADQNAPIEKTCVSWAHSLSEVMMACISNNLRIDLFSEYDYEPCDVKHINGGEFNDGKWRRDKYMGKHNVPILFAIVATKIDPSEHKL